MVPPKDTRARNGRGPGRNVSGRGLGTLGRGHMDPHSCSARLSHDDQLLHRQGVARLEPVEVHPGGQRPCIERCDVISR